MYVYMYICRYYKSLLVDSQLPSFPVVSLRLQVQGLRAQRSEVAEQLEAAEGREAAAKRCQERLRFTLKPSWMDFFMDFCSDFCVDLFMDVL